MRRKKENQITIEDRIEQLDKFELERSEVEDAFMMKFRLNN